MCDELHLSLATMGQISEEITRRPHEDFILLHLDRDSDDWVVSLNDKLDGLLVIEVMQAFQTRMIELIREQQAKLPTTGIVESVPLADAAATIHQQFS